MGIVRLVVLIIFLFKISDSFGQKRGSDITDTAFLKKTSYQKLNKYISYHVISEGKYSANSKLTYGVKILGSYYYLNHRYKKVKDDKEEYITATVVADLIKSSKFANREGFVGVFKINSKMEFIWKPDLLKKMVVTPVKDDARSLNLLKRRLTQQPFVNSLSLDTARNNPLSKLMGDNKPSVYFKLKLKPKYWNIDSLKVISKELNTWKELVNTGYTFEWFIGKNEQEDFFEIWSGIDIMPKKDAVKKKKNSFGDYVDSLKKH